VIFDGSTLPEDSCSIHLPGIQLIFAVMMMMRTKTKTQMLKSLTADEFDAFLCKNKCMSYDQIRAYAILATEPYPVPDPLALIARCGYANFVLHQWSLCVY